ncbi:protein kinase domain-containing protein [Streptomyces atratus]|uniref:protein kinase domain-containing protein n=1 Tax=Streptomyces atratus TaxID=1893 RepID=UPI0033C4D91A
MLGPLRGDSPGRIGPYEIRARLGAGGMGEVFLGDRGDGGDPVAVKTVRRDVARDPGFRHRFRREIAVARSVTSPFLAPLLDGDADAEVPWLATGYVAGPTLSAAVRRDGAMDEGEVRMLGAGLARALAAVHAAGVVHRDVKPGNVMLAEDGPRVIDFGIARDGSAAPLTTTGRMVGSPSFMSPEHVAGSGRVTFASDVFCLASVLCFAATGRDPFGDGPVAAVLYRVKYVEADLEGVPDALRAVLADCLTAEPADRPTAAELAERLAPGAARQWPETVRQHIAEYGRELARVRALDGPLLPGCTPTEAATGSRALIHQLPTQGTDFAPGLHAAPTQGPGLPTPEPPRRSRRALVAALVALVLAGAATGAILALRNNDGGKDTASSGVSSPATVAMVAGVDEDGGPDGSGTVAYGRQVRPAGWKPWRGKFTKAPLGCTAGNRVVVCRMVDGTYEALSAADGRHVWSRDTGETGLSAGYGPRGQFFMPAGATRPAVFGDTVVIVAAQRVQVLDARTGKVRWDARAGGAYTPESKPLVADGMVFVASLQLPEGTELLAYDLRTGTEKWRAPLAKKELAFFEKRNYWPLAAQGGALYALTSDGVRAYRIKDGTVLGTAAGRTAQITGDRIPDSGCGSVRVRGSAVFCPTYVSTGERGDFRDDLTLLRLKGPGLGEPDEYRLPKESVADTLLGAVADNVVTLRRQSLKATDRAGAAQPELMVVGGADGSAVGRYPLKLSAPGGRSNPTSAPMIVAGRVVWADSSALYTVPLGRDGRPGAVRRTVLDGAPGPTVAPAYDAVTNGVDFEKELLDPVLLPVGGVVHVIYDQGMAVSVPLPE